MNESLKRAMAESRLSEQDLAKALGVDPKTVHRWLAGRVPYPRSRSRIADLVSRDEHDIWPNLSPRSTNDAWPSGTVAVYPHRWAVPRTAWAHLFASAEREIGILVYAGLFLAEDVGVLHAIAQKADEGVRTRIMLGDPESPHVAERGIDEGVGDAMAAKIRNALVCYRDLGNLDGVEIRLHRTVLYASIYRADNDLMINSHIYGVSASNAPVLHLRNSEDGDMASIYLGSFEHIWTDAVPLT